MSVRIYAFDSFYSNLYRKQYIFRRWFDFEIIYFGNSTRNLILPFLRTICGISFNSSRDLNKFEDSPVSTPSIKISFGSSKHVQKYSTKKPLLLFHPSEFWQPQNSKRSQQNWFISIFMYKIFINYMPDFVPSRSQSKILLLNWKICMKNNWLWMLVHNFDTLKQIPKCAQVI